VAGPIGNPGLRATLGQLDGDKGRPEVVQPDVQPALVVLEQFGPIDSCALQMIPESFGHIIARQPVVSCADEHIPLARAQHTPDMQGSHHVYRLGNVPPGSGVEMPGQLARGELRLLSSQEA
jgi:hypothetical protein